MKKNKTSFGEAYSATKNQYKSMRMSDRVHAFQYLLNDRSNYYNGRYYLYNYFQTILKLYFKGYPYSEHIETLIRDSDKITLKNLIGPLVSDNFYNDVENYFQDLKNLLKLRYSDKLLEEYWILRAGLFDIKEMLVTKTLQQLAVTAEKSELQNPVNPGL